ncbi:very long chain fatty acid elongase AAEL008004-like [Augochlora pura]
MSLAEIYDYYIIQLSDKRTLKWPLMESPKTVLFLTLAYLYIVLIYGPRYMKDRKPYSFRTFIYWYNIFQIFANATLIYKVMDAGWYSGAYWTCTEGLEGLPGVDTNTMVSVSWYGLCLKIIDFIETILFVLRKKTKQITFLHVYHHASAVIVTWAFVKYVPNGYLITVGGTNSLVHVLMYTYYLLAAHGPKMQKILAPIKPMITIIQMAQFVVMFIYSIHMWFCDTPGMKIPITIMTVNIVVNFFLFYNFYKKSYIKKEKKVNKD